MSKFLEGNVDKGSGDMIYKSINKKRNIIIISLLIALVISFILDLIVGPSWIDIEEIMKSLFQISDNNIQNTVILNIRLPMTITCILVGASLGLAGVQMQTILANPLASPYTLGISSSASFGASIAILTGINILGSDWLSIPILAFISAFFATMLIYLIGKWKGMTSNTMILSGIVIHFLFQSLQSAIQYIASAETSQQIVFWSFGSLLKANWTGVSVTGGIFIISAIIMAKSIWQVTALSAGEERAQSLGINIDKLRLKIFCISALLTTGAVSFVGTIGFVGLVAPHFARMSVGEDQRYLSPVSAIYGALLLTVASIIAKIVKPGIIMPIGIVTSLIGVPFLLYIILMRRK